MACEEAIHTSRHVSNLMAGALSVRYITAIGQTGLQSEGKVLISTDSNVYKRT